MTHPSPLISVTSLTKRYGTRTILDGIDLDIHRGETVTLLGPSGGGKSTLLRCINGLNDWDSGAIRVGEHLLDGRIDSWGEGSAVRRVRRIIGMVFQDFQLFPHLTALENVILAPCQVLDQAPNGARELARSLLERVGLGERADYYPRQLSGGQKQRVAIARALAMQPEGLLCDEITSSLDPELKHEVLEVLEDLKRDGMTIVMVTHEIGFARRAADRIVVLAEGRIAEQGPPGEVIDRPSTERTRRFLRNVLG